MKIHLCQCSNLSCNGRCRWCLYLLNLQYSMPDTLLCYITIQYFILLVFFFGFLYHTQAKYRGDILLWAPGGGEESGIYG
jgi:hypothetical protein